MRETARQETRGALGLVPETAAERRMLLLVTTGHPDFERFGNHHAMGRLIQPRHTSSIEKTAAEGIPWAADNDCFQGLDAEAYVKMLDRIAGLPGCRFVTVPDHVGDWEATAFMFERWAPALERRGLPVALVAQNGLTVDTPWLRRTWHRLSALFIGGSNECVECGWIDALAKICQRCYGRMLEWKESEAAAELIVEAQRRGLWVHIGRVNTGRRIRLCRDELHADSVDGSKWARFKNTYLAEGLEDVGQHRALTITGELRRAA